MASCAFSTASIYPCRKGRSSPSLGRVAPARSEEHTSELQSPVHLLSFPTRRSSDLELSGVAGDAVFRGEDERRAGAAIDGRNDSRCPLQRRIEILWRAARSRQPRSIRAGRAEARHHWAEWLRQDRKSTRLNSSHPSISSLSLHDALPILSYPASLATRYFEAKTSAGRARR